MGVSVACKVSDEHLRGGVSSTFKLGVMSTWFCITSVKVVNKGDVCTACGGCLVIRESGYLGHYHI